MKPPAIRRQPKRVTKIDRIPARKAIEIEPTRDPDRILLREPPRFRIVIAIPQVLELARVRLRGEQAPEPRAVIVVVLVESRGRLDPIRPRPFAGPIDRRDEPRRVPVAAAVVPAAQGDPAPEGDPRLKAGLGALRASVLKDTGMGVGACGARWVPGFARLTL